MQHWCRSQHNLRHCCLVWTPVERQALPGEGRGPDWSPTSSCSPFLSISYALSSSWRVDLQDAQVGNLSRTEGSNVLHRSRTEAVTALLFNSSFSSSRSSSVGQHHCDLQNTLLALFTGKYGKTATIYYLIHALVVISDQNAFKVDCCSPKCEWAATAACFDRKMLLISTPSVPTMPIWAGCKMFFFVSAHIT